jgi:REP element-mobilizing transposase RayT
MPIVVDDTDRRRWLQLLARTASRFRWRIHVYCLLDNHFHLVVEGTLEDVSLGMHRLGGVYAQRFNERHDRVGHLYQERFHAKVIRDEEHLEDACTYVLANPVRAGLCASPEQ